MSSHSLSSTGVLSSPDSRSSIANIQMEALIRDRALLLEAGSSIAKALDLNELLCPEQIFLLLVSAKELGIYSYLVFDQVPSGPKDVKCEYISKDLRVFPHVNLNCSQFVHN
jgi:hypothetical protein